MNKPGRGVGLIEALVALAILSMGMLAMTRMQGGLIAQSAEAQTRQTASYFASELLSTVHVDGANAACYTLPQTGACANTGAITRTAAWASRASAGLPGPVATTAVYTPADGRVAVTITWRGKHTGDTRSLETTTDVRL